MADALPQILLLGLDDLDFFETGHKPFITSLAQKATIHRAKTVSEANTLLAAAHSLTAILCTDPGLRNPQRAALLTTIINHVKSDGGTVIFMGQFSSFLPPPGVERFFGDKWALPWSAGEYTRSDFARNTTFARFDAAEVPDRCTLKVVMLRGVRKDAALYLPLDPAFVQRDTFASSADQGFTQTPIALQAVGRGWLGYVGDSVGHDATTKIILAMCGL